jgi:photosynthetic reaction center cytochrome c subunit
MTALRRIGGLLTVAVLVTACEAPPVETVQSGFRGLGLESVINPERLQDSVTAILARQPAVQPPPAALGELPPAAPGTYENVQVLGHLSEAEFTLTMNALVQWVAPVEGCNYCHVVTPDSVNYAADDIYTKVVARRMLQMVQDINVNWSEHVAEDRGVNCWTCHQGQPVPTNYWFYDSPTQIHRYYLDRDDARIQGPWALASEGENRRSVKQMEWTYAVMMNMSNALGVNCSYCHVSARFADWDYSTPQRVTALRGARMIRNANMEYMVSLQGVWPTSVDEYAGYPDRPRLGPMGDGPKLQCSTCHIGAYKPQFSDPASWGAGWKALTEIGRPHPTAAPAEGEGG